MNPVFGLVGRLNTSPVLLEPSFDMVSTVRYAMSNPDMETEMSKHMANVAMSYGASYSQTGERLPYFVVQGVAVIPVQGVLVNRLNWASSWMTGYDYVQAAAQHAMANPDVKGLMFDLSSFGGEAQGCFEAAAFLHGLRGQKPMHGIINSNACSACYMLAASLDHLTMTPTGMAGSIGVVMMHVDYSKMLDKAGIAVTFIYEGDHKVDGNPYEPLTGPVKKEMQALAKNLYDMFVNTVADYRGMDVQAVRDTQARVFVAPDALSIGLIDAVAAAPVAMTAFVNELSGSNKEVMMNTEAQAAAKANAASASAATAPGATAPGATAPAGNEGAAQGTTAPAASAPAAPTANAAANERARIQAITGSEEAKGRSALANHLAFNTDMSADDAKKLLAVSAKETAQASAGETFAAAMEASGNPGVGAGDEGKTTAPAASGADAILASYSMATGFKVGQ